MGHPVKYATYLVITVLSLMVFIYYMSNTEFWDLYGYNLGFLVLVGSIIYTGYMFIHELMKSDAQVIVEDASDNVVNNPAIVIEKNFMKDSYFKYLFAFSFSVLLFYIIYTLRSNFTNFDLYPSNWYYMADLYVNLVLPVFLLCDAMMTNRY